MHRAGLETMLMNYYRHVDRTQIQFDFLTHRPNRSDYDDEIEALGGRVFYAPRLYPQNLPTYFTYMAEFYKEHQEYRIVHSHIDSMSYLPLLAAKRAGVPYRIAHSHNTSIDKDFKYILKQYYRKRIKSVANIYCACGQEAGRFLFGKNANFSVFANAIQTDNFVYNEVTRNNKRKELDIEDKTVIGHVGRLSYQKNHKFLLEIFSQIIKDEKNAVLMLIGVGEKENEIRNRAKSLGLDDKVLFLGNRSDVNELYQAMDIFVMPSLFEGIPVVGVEAQFSGLPIVFSDKVPDEVAFTPLCTFIPLSSPADLWAKRILEIQKNEIDRSHAVIDNRYNIEFAYKKLENFYLQLK